MIDPAAKSTPLRLGRQGDEHAGSIEKVTLPGRYTLKVSATDAAGQPLGETTAHFDVMDQDVEFANPAADPDQMARLANLTRDSGGRPLAPEQLAPLLEEIRDHPPELVEEVLTKWQVADTWWDAWLILLILGSHC